jgi:ATP-binding protein involved in chromosome partitioning
VKKAVTFTRKMNKPLIGIIENMSGFVCPKCGAETAIFNIGGGERLSKELNIPFLGRVPIDPRISESSDRGTAFIIDQPKAPSTQAFAQIVDKIEEYLNRSGNQQPQN